MTQLLEIKLSKSKGYYTHGYRMITLIDNTTGKRYRTSGGGYDMVGIVMANWLADVHQEAMATLFKAQGFPLGYSAYSSNEAKTTGRTYGGRLSPEGVASMNGGCGLEAVLRLATAMGLDIKPIYKRDRNGDVIDVTHYKVS